MTDPFLINTWQATALSSVFSGSPGPQSRRKVRETFPELLEMQPGLCQLQFAPAKKPLGTGAKAAGAKLSGG